MSISSNSRKLSKIVVSGALVLVGVVGMSTTVGANATPNTITAPVNTASCSATPPALVNGSFEEFSNPATDPTVATGTHNGSAYYGIWHGYGNGPDQILFLKPSAVPASGETANSVTGWLSTSPLIEIQRQVGSYSSRHNNAGVLFPVSPPQSGIASASTTGAGGSYYDLYAAQPADGTYWAELNAIDSSALYQDVVVPSSARMFWSIKHRGRSDTSEEMKVLIGPVVNGVATTTQQTTISKYSPTNADVYVGVPTYGSSTTTSRIISKLSDGWNRFEGTVDPDTSPNPPATRTMRLQFEAVSGAFGWTSFGNMLDDIQFSALLACPVTTNLRVGETSSLNVTGLQPGSTDRFITYGVRQQLDAIGNSSAPSSEFSVSGNTVNFTPTTAGTFTTDYQVAMNFGGQSYEVASRITYVVTGNPSNPGAAGKPSGLPATGFNLETWVAMIFGITSLGALLIAGSLARRSRKVQRKLSAPPGT